MRLRAFLRCLLSTAVLVNPVAIWQSADAAPTVTSVPLTNEKGDPTQGDRLPAAAAANLKSAAPPYPKAIQLMLEQGRQDCLAEGGTSLTYGPGIVRTMDLTGDKRPDYIIDFREARCTGRLQMFNGTGGWDLVILTGRRTGQPSEVFSGRVRDYDISSKPGPRTMTFHLHGGFCGRGGTDECIKRRRMSHRHFEFRE